MQDNIEKDAWLEEFLSLIHIFSEEDYTEELWNEQKMSGERNRATALHK